MKFWIALVVLAGLTGGLWAQTPTTPPTPSTAAPANDPVPAGDPYEEGEFPEVLTDIQRAEILTLGTFPFALLLSGIAYDWYYYLNVDPTLKAWPLGTGTSIWSSTNHPEKLNSKNTVLILTGIGIGVSVAVLDYIFGQIDRDKKRRADAAKFYVPTPSDTIPWEKPKTGESGPGPDKPAEPETKADSGAPAPAEDRAQP